MSGIYTLLILFSVLAVGTALKCHACTSTSSWDNCKENSQKGPCKDPFLTRCGKMEITLTDKRTGKITHTYGKGCAKTCNTNDIKTCRNGYDQNGDPMTCTMHCCSGDYCNAGSSLVASIIIPTICALISVVFTKMH